MSRKLYLMRHCEAESAYTTTDHDRALTENGLSQAERLGLILNGNPFDLVSCSTAKRTMQTLEGLKRAGCTFGQEVFLDKLYNATPDALADIILENPVDSHLILAHNPGIHQMAFALAQEAQKQDSPVLDQLMQGFVPGSIACFEGEKLVDLIRPE